MDKLPDLYRLRIQEATRRYRRLEAEQQRHLYREITAKLAIVLGPLIVVGSFFTGEVGLLGAASAAVACGAGVLYQLDTRVTEPLRLREQERIAEALERLGVKLSHNGRKAASLGRLGERGRFLDPFDTRSYE
jgi:hypothetical protein